MENNISMQTDEKPQQTQPPKLTEISVTNENEALNLMVSFLHMAQKRGAFNLEESAKIWDCVQLFMRKA
jgi:hypothetical protein|uniref:Uncharacterized protein n=1 Tax=viral metagenome TaxID=1070528 RepID=A0A6C0CKW8_9ZZZZ